MRIYPRDWPPGLRVIKGPRGACVQRNRAIDAVIQHNDLIVFLDDDYVPSRYFLENAEKLFADHADIAGATGLVLADGVGRGSLSFDDACAIVAEHDARLKDEATSFFDVRHAYGCNMAFRAAAIAIVRL